MLNAANEVAVEAFLAGRIGFLSIAALVEATLAANGGLTTCHRGSVDDVLAIDAEARVGGPVFFGAVCLTWTAGLRRVKFQG